MLALATQVLTAWYLKTSGKKWLGMLLLAGLIGAGYVAASKPSREIRMKCRPLQKAASPIGKQPST